jgi:hypothetical protein
MLLIELALEQSIFTQALESLGQNVARQTQAGLELVEPTRPRSGFPENQQGPTVANDFESTSDRAHLTIVFSFKHSLILTRDSCVKQLGMV